MLVMVVYEGPIILEGSNNLVVASRRQMMRDLIGWEPPVDCFFEICRIYVSRLANYINQLGNVTDDTPKINMQLRVRLYLL